MSEAKFKLSISARPTTTEDGRGFLAFKVTRYIEGQTDVQYGTWVTNLATDAELNKAIEATFRILVKPLLVAEADQAFTEHNFVMEEPTNNGIS